MELGERIRSLRKQKGLTQEELASRLGLQKSAVAKYENGRVTNIKRATLFKMAEILEVSPGELMYGKEDKGQEDHGFAVLSGYYGLLNKAGRTKVLEQVHDLTLIPAYRLDRGLSLMPVAAHNDDAKDAEQLRLMEEDLDNM